MKSNIANDGTQNASAVGTRKLGLSIALLGACFILLACVPSLTAQNAYLPGSLQVVSTVPSNGDVNPHGVAFVPANFPVGILNPGDILVSNFNNNQNLQGTGTTIVRVTPQAATSVFFTAQPNQQGLSTALWVLQEGLVIVVNFPSPDGTCGSAGNGGLLVINSSGQQVQTITDDTSSTVPGTWPYTTLETGRWMRS